MSDKPEYIAGLWTEASSEVIHIAERLIRDYHPHLKSARICFVFRKEAQKQKGREILGQASKVPPKMQPFFEFDFLIWLSEEDYGRMSMGQREAIIDHELTHCGFGQSGWTIRDHDITEFTDIIKRHGLWSMDLFQMGVCLEEFKQEGLPGTEHVTLTKHGRVSTLTGELLDRVSEVGG